MDRAVPRHDGVDQRDRVFLSVRAATAVHIVGIISLVVLAATLWALYVRHLAGAWRWIYVSTAVLALYLNVFVGVVQAFLKFPFLKALAPTQTEPPFVIAQAAVLVLFVVLGILAARSFHPESEAFALKGA